MKRSEIPRNNGAVVGCYSVHLYCQHPNHSADYNAFPSVAPDGVIPFVGDYTERNKERCLRDARAAGWWISNANYQGERAVLCPYHAREVPR